MSSARLQHTYSWFASGRFTYEARHEPLGAESPGRARTAIRGPRIRRFNAHRRGRGGRDRLHGGRNRKIARLSRRQRAPVLVVASGGHRIDERKIAALVGEPIARADADFVREATGFAIGGVPPIGHRTAPIALIDESLMAFAEIWAAAGTPNAVFRLSPVDLVALTGGTVAAVRRH